jgi:hypothetical protein
VNNINMSSNINQLPPFPISQLNTNLQSIQFLLSQTSSLLRTLVLACLVINIFFFLSSFLTLGVRYIGMTTLLSSLISSGHTVATIMVLSPHISNNHHEINNIHPSSLQFDQILQYTSHQYTNNPLAYGTIMGGTFMLVPLMQAVSSYYGGIASCVAHRGSRHDMHMLHNTTSYYFDSYGVCGSSGPVHFVSFLSSLLSWLYLAIAVLLYTRRGELLDGQIGSVGGGSYQYDEIGESDGGRGFAGDFPNGGVARTLQV